jgi:DNA invertase Pin-like site-specific DNA recombinase
MPKKYLYTSEALSQLSHAEQEKLFPEIDFDLIVFETNSTANRPHRAWNGLRPMLQKGDVLAIASPSVFSYSLPMLNKQLCKLLARGITIQLGLPNLTICPTSADPAFQLILAYDAHMRNSMSRNVKAGLAASVRGGRPSRLTVDQLPELRAMMADKSLTMKDISNRFQVSRSTIYNFLGHHSEP